MAEYRLYDFTLLTDIDPSNGYTTGRIIRITWSTDTNGFVGRLLETDGTYITFMFTGPSLGILNIDYRRTSYNYQFCSNGANLSEPGSTLNFFDHLSWSPFPYITKFQVANSTVCALGAVCDLEVDGVPTITPASTLSDSDGAFTINATSSNGSIKYSLSDFEFETGGQTSGTFTDLSAGTYTVYIKDSFGCSTTTTVLVTAEENYGLRYFSEWDDIINQHRHKVEIEFEEYIGETEEMTTAGIPAIYRVNADGDERFVTIRASEFRLRVIVRTNFQYASIYGGHKRYARLKYSRDEGDGYSLQWIGYIDPYLYNEAYKATPYEMEILATDGLADLKELDFIDSSGNDFINRLPGRTIIAEILKKTDLNLNIISGINITEDNFLDGTDALSVTYNPLVYYDLTKITDGHLEAKDCAYVLDNILKEFSATICQADGKWVIFRTEETRGTFNYREFDSNGSQIGTGTIDPIVYLKNKDEVNRIVWRDQSGSRTMLPAYGKFIVRQILNKKQSLLPSSGFEEWNVVPYSGNTEFFKGWNITYLYGNGAITWGHERVERGDSNGCMYVQFQSDPTENPNPGYKEVLIYSTSADITYKTGDGLKIAFDYLIEYLKDGSLPWVMIEFKVKVGNYYYHPLTGWTETDSGYIEQYITKFNEFQTYSVVVPTPPGAVTEVSGKISFYIRINNGGFSSTDTSYGLDYLDSVVTLNKSGLKRIIYGDSFPGGRYYYDLEVSNDLTSYPNTIRVGDYDATTNQKVWRLVSSLDDVGALIGINSILLDNAVVEYLPDLAPSPEFIENIVTVNPNNKRTLEVEILQGDCPTNITNAKHTYDSYLQYAIVSTLPFPTDLWTREGITESSPLAQVLLKSYLSQFMKNAFRLQGSFISDIYLKPYSTVVETMDNNRLYQTMGLEIEFKNNTHTLDLYELKDITAPPDEGGGNPTPFSGAFDPLAFNINFD